MRYIGMPKGMWLLFSGSFRKQLAGYMALFIIRGIDGTKHGFGFDRFFLRFFIIGTVIKAFDIIALDYCLLTKTHFFQHYFQETEGCAGRVGSTLPAFSFYRARNHTTELIRVPFTEDRPVVSARDLHEAV